MKRRTKALIGTGVLLSALIGSYMGAKYISGKLRGLLDRLPVPAVEVVDDVPSVSLIIPEQSKVYTPQPFFSHTTKKSAPEPLIKLVSRTDIPGYAEAYSLLHELYGCQEWSLKYRMDDCFRELRGLESLRYGYMGSDPGLENYVHEWGDRCAHAENEFEKMQRETIISIEDMSHDEEQKKGLQEATLDAFLSCPNYENTDNLFKYNSNDKLKDLLKMFLEDDIDQNVLEALLGNLKTRDLGDDFLELLVDNAANTKLPNLAKKMYSLIGNNLLYIESGILFEEATALLKDRAYNVDDFDIRADAFKALSGYYELMSLGHGVNTEEEQARYMRNVGRLLHDTSFADICDETPCDVNMGVWLVQTFSELFVHADNFNNIKGSPESQQFLDAVNEAIDRFYGDLRWIK